MSRKEVERQRPAQIVACGRAGLISTLERKSCRAIEETSRGHPDATGKAFPSPRTGKGA